MFLYGSVHIRLLSKEKKNVRNKKYYSLHFQSIAYMLHFTINIVPQVNMN